MPVYNAASTLNNTLTSLRNQSFADWELVVVDDGSTDSSRDIVRRYAANDARVRLLTPGHQGIVESLALGLEKCRTNLVARLDADDICHPRRLEMQTAFLEAHPEVAAVGSAVRIFPRVTMTGGMLRYETWLNSLSQPEDIERDIFVESPLVHPSVMFRQDQVRQAGGYVPSPWPEDYYLWLRMWHAGLKLAKMPQVLLYWRDIPGRLTRCDPRCTYDSLRELKVEMFLRSHYPQVLGLDIPALPVAKYLHANQVLDKKLLIWGAGPNGKALAKSLQAKGLKPYAYIDIRQARRGQVICNMPVWGIDQLPDPKEYFLITAVGNPRSREEIRAHLNSHGWVERENYRCTAGISS